jgi:hypothetical protein
MSKKPLRQVLSDCASVRERATRFISYILQKTIKNQQDCAQGYRWF